MGIENEAIEGQVTLSQAEAEVERVTTELRRLLMLPAIATRSQENINYVRKFMDAVVAITHEWRGQLPKEVHDAAMSTYYKAYLMLKSSN